jgi:hypothetical protein
MQPVTLVVAARTVLTALRSSTSMRKAQISTLGSLRTFALPSSDSAERGQIWPPGVTVGTDFPRADVGALARPRALREKWLKECIDLETVAAHQPAPRGSQRSRHYLEGTSYREVARPQTSSQTGIPGSLAR